MWGQTTQGGGPNPRFGFWCKAPKNFLGNALRRPVFLGGGSHQGGGVPRQAELVWRDPPPGVLKSSLLGALDRQCDALRDFVERHGELKGLCLKFR